MTVFSPQPLKKLFFFAFFRQSDPPRKSQNVKMPQFLQWILKDDDVYFQKITASKIWGNSFINEKYRDFTQYAAATILRHWAMMS